MSQVQTLEEIKREQAFHRCRLALKQIDVPPQIIDQFSPGPFLDQFCHLTIMLEPPMHWREALIWINDHSGEILKHSKTYAPSPSASKAK